MPPDTPAIIVGAGIAGLVAALSLAARGFPSHVIERASVLREAGAGIQLSPNALRVLDRLDLLASLRARSIEAGYVTLRHWRTGRTIVRVPVRGSDGIGYFSLHRSILQGVLLEAVQTSRLVRLELGMELVSAEATETGVRVDLRRTADGTGESRVVGALVAADGVRSRVGNAFGEATEAASGDVAWRLTAKAPDVSFRGIEAWLGPRRHAVAYPVGENGTINLVLLTQGGDPASLGVFRRWDPRLRALVESGEEPPTPWPLATVDRRSWTADRPRILFIGDAAHAMLPYAAQGAALAIEDGYVAAACLADAPDVASAWHRFEETRRIRIEAVRKRVAFHRFAYHLPAPFSLARDAVLAMRSQASVARDLAWLYDWRPPRI